MLTRLAEKTDVGQLLRTLSDLDSEELSHLTDGTSPQGLQRPSPTPPVNSDACDVFEDLTDRQSQTRETVRSFMLEEVEPIGKDVWEAGTFPKESIPRAGELFGSNDQRERFLKPLGAFEPLGAFDMIGSWALTEPDHGSDVSRGLETTARREGDTWVFSGAKKWAGNATFADVTVVWAGDAADGHVNGFLVEQERPGYNVEQIGGKIAKRSVENGLIELDGGALPAANRLPVPTLGTSPDSLRPAAPRSPGRRRASPPTPARRPTPTTTDASSLASRRLRSKWCKASSSRCLER